MGIKNFGKILGIAKDGVKKASYSDFSGQTWAIDASIFFYRFSHNSQSKKPNSHIDGFYQLFFRLLKFKIRPILVLDGKSPLEKHFALESRLVHKQKNIDKIEKLKEELAELINHDIPTSPQQLDNLIEQLKGSENETLIITKLNEFTKANKNVIHFQPRMYDDIYTLCELFDIPIIRANGEADVLCATLYKSGIAQAVMSEDSDMLMYGAGILIRKFGWTNEIEVLDLKKILESLGITYERFIDLAILCGTDYTPCTITGLGPVTALDYIKNGFLIEQIINNILKSPDSKYRIPSPETFMYKEARNLINNAYQSEKVVSINPFDLQRVRWDEIIFLLTENCNYRESTILKHMDTLKEIYPIIKQKIKISLKLKSETEILPK